MATNRKTSAPGTKRKAGGGRTAKGASGAGRKPFEYRGLLIRPSALAGDQRSEEIFAAMRQAALKLHVVPE